MAPERWHEDTEESWLYVDRGRDWTDAVISQGRPCLPEVGKDKDGSSSKSFVRYMILPTPWFQTSGLQSWETINLFVVLCEGCPGTLRGCPYSSPFPVLNCLLAFWVLTAMPRPASPAGFLPDSPVFVATTTPISWPFVKVPFPDSWPICQASPCSHISVFLLEW